MVHTSQIRRGWQLAHLFGIVFTLLGVSVGPTLAQDRELGTIELEVNLELGGADEADEYILGNLSAVVEDSEGNIYASDVKQQAVHKFASNGRFLTSMTLVGGGPGDLMPHASLAIDSKDRLYFAGQGGRVEIVDTSFEPIESFQRENPAEIPRGISVLGDGSVAISVKNLGKETTIDLYGPDHIYVSSFSDSFGKGRDLSWHVTNPYTGGDIALLGPATLVYAQIAPYSIRAFDSAGRLIVETSDGGFDFVPDPPMPKIESGRVSYRMPPSTTGVATVIDDNVLVSSHRLDENNQGHTLLCLYDQNLVLLGLRESSGSEFVVGSTRGGEVFVFQRSDEAFLLVKATVRLVKT